MVEVDGPPRRPFHRRRPCVCCCLVLFIFLVLVAVVIVILAFTVFKPKEVQVTLEKVELLNFDADLGSFSGVIPSPSVNLTFAVVVAVHNPNRVSFTYSGSEVTVSYHDDEVALAPIPAGRIGSQGTETISTTLVVLTNRLVANLNLPGDFVSGKLPFTTLTQISGRVKIVFVKRHADITSRCSVTVSIASRSISSSNCANDVDL